VNSWSQRITSRPSGLKIYRRYISLRVSVRKFWQEFWIFEAIRSGDSDRLEDHLKRYRVDLNKPRFLGETALHIATKNGLRRMVEDLIYYGADLSLKSAQGQTPLQLAVENGDFEMVELLLSNGARPDTK
jgi:ankyrin repeat protein